MNIKKALKPPIKDVILPSQNQLYLTTNHDNGFI